jgi:hypothetical protein
MAIVAKAGREGALNAATLYSAQKGRSRFGHCCGDHSRATIARDSRAGHKSERVIYAVEDAVSRGLTRLAKDEGVPVLVLSQLSRGEKGNANRRPTMSDLRESSQLENDAHCVILLHRLWDEDAGRMSSSGEIIIAKQRSGETGVFPVEFDRRSLMFKDAPQRQQGAARTEPQVIGRRS